jgi:glycosyltransferase involved in cell wall biosynthesis
MRVVVLGMMGRTPFAGVAWQVLHYLEGFRRAGCDVFYVEDTGAWPYDPEHNTVTDDPGYTVRYLHDLLRRVGMDGRWAYVAPNRTVHGTSSTSLARAVAAADVIVNLTGATVLREEHLQVPIRVYLETDPVAPQIEVAQRTPFTVELLAGHTHHLTFGENLGGADCGVPVDGFDYRPTRQPVVLDWWRPDGAKLGPSFTTVASWRQVGRDVEWRGETYFWSKDREFLKMLELPRQVAPRIELALACDDDSVLELLRDHGWSVRDALEFSLSPDRYRAYIVGSRAEFTVAKDQNVRLRSGWFSDRSACYLAAGRPVVTQTTGFENVLPTGEGLFAFETVDDAAAAIEEIDADYERHSTAAAELAREYFDAQRVISALLREVGAS